MASAWVSMRSILPRKAASVFVRAPVIAPLPQEMLGRHGVNPEPIHLFMICSNIKLRYPAESIGSDVYVFREQSQWDRRKPFPLPLWERVDAMRSIADG